MMRSVSHFLCSVILFFLSIASHAQDETTPSQRTDGRKGRDEAILIQPGMDTTNMNIQIDSIYLDEDILNRPKKAAYLSAVLPGLGQAYNNRLWKIPVIYGAFGTIGYYIGWNNNKYQQYRNAYLLKKSYPLEELDDPLAIEISEDNLQRGLDYYRRNRDFLMIVLTGVYVLQVLDAYIDAHLMEFDVSEDLSLRIEPGIESQSLWTAQQYGLKLTLNIN